MTDRKQRDDMPPVPRDYREPSYSELVPFKSTQINIVKSPILYLVLVTGLVAIGGFGYMGEMLQNPSIETFQAMVLSVITYMLLVVLLVVFLYSKTDKPFWAFLISMAFVALLLLTPLGMPYFLVFREILPGKMEWATNTTDFVKAFIGMFFAAGLCEELMKMTPALLGAYLAFKPELADKMGTRWYEALRVRGPLDGLLLGVFGGAGFILIETGLEYLPRNLMQIYQQTGNANDGIASALMLLMPRTIGGMVGHMAWAGINGYFIGLCVLRRGETLKIIGGAWVVTSALHAMWNTSNFVGIFTYLSAALSGVFLVACLLKARQLEMSLGRGVESYGSIVVGAPVPAGQPSRPAAPAGAASSPPAAAAKQDTVAAPPPAATAAGKASPDVAADGLRLVFESATVPVALGALDLSTVAGGEALQAEVTRHPTRPDVLGLRNGGGKAWTATLRDGSEQTIDPGRNLRLAAGVKIDFGSGVAAEIIGA